MPQRFTTRRKKFGIESEPEDIFRHTEGLLGAVKIGVDNA